MKRAFCILLVALVLIPCFSFAAESIVGSWYFLFDKSAYPEFAGTYGNIDYLISIYTFLEDGSILCSNLSFSGTDITPLCSSVGKWEKNLFNYNYSILGLGSGTASVDGDTLLMKIDQYGFSMKFPRLVPFDFYSGYIY